MAVWQFGVVLVPDAWAQENNYRVEKLIAEDGYDTEHIWLDRQPSSNFIQILSSVLPITESWHEELLIWGDLDTHDIQVWYEGRVLSSVSFRIALNKSCGVLLEDIIRVAKELDCVLFFPETKTIEKPVLTTLKNALVNSNAAKFVTNPEKFLSELPDLDAPAYIESSDDA